MFNIFTAPEEEVTLDRVRAFLALDAEVELRPREGAQIDYKSKDPRDLAKLVVAFANTDGGIGFVGVEEGNGLPVRLAGRQRGRTELKTAITNAVRNSIEVPCPDFDVIVLADEADREIALVRVPQGDDQPYQHQNGTVYIRVGDMTVHARVSEILELASNRARRGHELGADELPDVWIRRKGGETGDRSLTFVRVFVAPVRELDVRIDRRFEKSFSTRLHDSIESGFVVDARRGGYLEWRHHIAEGDVEQRVAAREGGLLCYTGQCTRDGKTILLPIVEAMARFMYLAAGAYKEHGHFGRVHVSIELSTHRSEIVGTDKRESAVLGIHEVSVEPVARVERTVFTVPMDELESSTALIAEGLFEQLRNERGASIDFPVLAKAVHVIVAHLASRRS